MPFTRQEIDNVIKEMPGDRAPGADGFNGTFLKACWRIIKEDFYALCDQFLRVVSTWRVSTMDSSHSSQKFRRHKELMTLDRSLC